MVPMLVSRIPRTVAELDAADFVRSAPPAWAVGGDVPVSVRRVTLRPDEITAPHNHHDTELWLVLNGHGEARSNAEVLSLNAGDSVRLEPLGVHTLRNLSATEPLTFLTLWWEDMAALSAQVPDEPDIGADSERPLVLLPSFPTPNGELHLGHLAGPYLNADICRRWARATGQEVFTLLGTVGTQSQVAAAAAAQGLAFLELAERNTTAIMQGLTAAGMGWDTFVRPSSEGYPQLAEQVFQQLLRQGSLVRRTEPTAFCDHCDRFLFEAFVAGRCPHCGSNQTAGIECEACALPFSDGELVDPSCAQCGAPATRRELTRYFLPLEPLRSRLSAYLARAGMNTRLRGYTDKVLGSPLPDLPVTVVAEVGVAVRVEQDQPGSPYEQQRMYSAFELLARYLVALDQLAVEQGQLDWRQFVAERSLRTVLFFGFDNAFLRAFAFPAVLSAFTDRLPLPEALVCNEFYLLDGEKFSTSRRHAIWGRAAFDPETQDQLRLFLAATSPDIRRRGFAEQSYREFVTGTLGSWQSWLDGVSARLETHFDSLAPEAGAWSAETTRFYRDVRRLPTAVAAGYRPDGYSLRYAVAALDAFVEQSRLFAEQVDDVLSSSAQSGLARTFVALELMAVRTFAAAVAPIAPQFADRLRAGLADGTEPDVREAPRWVAAGTKVRLADRYFAGELSMDDARARPRTEPTSD